MNGFYFKIIIVKCIWSQLRVERYPAEIDRFNLPLYQISRPSALTISGSCVWKVENNFLFSDRHLYFNEMLIQC